MFDDLDEDQIELEEMIDKPSEDLDDEEAKARRGVRKYTVGEVSGITNFFLW